MTKLDSTLLISFNVEVFAGVTKLPSILGNFVTHTNKFCGGLDDGKNCFDLVIIKAPNLDIC